MLHNANTRVILRGDSKAGKEALPWIFAKVNRHFQIENAVGYNHEVDTFKLSREDGLKAIAQTVHGKTTLTVIAPSTDKQKLIVKEEEEEKKGEKKKVLRQEKEEKIYLKYFYHVDLITYPGEKRSETGDPDPGDPDRISAINSAIACGTIDTTSGQLIRIEGIETPYNADAIKTDSFWQSIGITGHVEMLEYFVSMFPLPINVPGINEEIIVEPLHPPVIGSGATKTWDDEFFCVKGIHINRGPGFSNLEPLPVNTASACSSLSSPLLDGYGNPIALCNDVFHEESCPDSSNGKAWWYYSNIGRYTMLNATTFYCPSIGVYTFNNALYTTENPTRHRVFAYDSLLGQIYNGLLQWEETDGTYYQFDSYVAGRTNKGTVYLHEDNYGPGVGSNIYFMGIGAYYDSITARFLEVEYETAYIPYWYRGHMTVVAGHLGNGRWPNLFPLTVSEEFTKSLAIVHAKAVRVANGEAYIINHEDDEWSDMTGSALVSIPETEMTSSPITYWGMSTVNPTELTGFIWSSPEHLSMDGMMMVKETIVRTIYEKEV